jgi:hypothetical protein
MNILLIKLSLFFYFLQNHPIFAHDIEEEIELFKKFYPNFFQKTDENKVKKNYSIKKCNQENVCFSKPVSDSMLYAASFYRPESNIDQKPHRVKKGNKKKNVQLFLRFVNLRVFYLRNC